MDTKSDIQNREDVVRLVDSFYYKVRKDEYLAPIFEMPEEEWQRHLPRMYNFWENWLFQTGNYDGGMMWVHIQANERTPLNVGHFERWLSYFFITTDELFAGERAEFVKSKALEIGQIMNAKLNQINTQKELKS